MGTSTCDYCGEAIGVYGWLRPSHSSVAPRALCNDCMTKGPASDHALLLAVADAAEAFMASTTFNVSPYGRAFKALLRAVDALSAWREAT